MLRMPFTIAILAASSTFGFWFDHLATVVGYGTVVTILATVIRINGLFALNPASYVVVGVLFCLDTVEQSSKLEKAKVIVYLCMHFFSFYNFC